MAVLKSVLTSAAALLGVFANGALAMAANSDGGDHTETQPAQELGSTTSDGSLVYSMNYCTVVHTTACDVSLSTGGPAPTAPGQTSPVPGTSIPYGGPPGGGTPSGGADTSTPYGGPPGGETSFSPPADTHPSSAYTPSDTGSASDSGGGGGPEPTTTATSSGYGDETPSATETRAVESSPGAAAALGVRSGAVLGVAGVAAAAYLF